jgi:hypothetical protein
VQAINATGQFISGGTVNFTTLGGPPAVTTTTPTMITPTKARLAATVNPNDLPTSVAFYVGGQLVGTVNVSAGSSAQTVTFDYQQLIPGQSITFHAIGTNQLAPTPVNGGNNTFSLMPSDTTIGTGNNTATPAAITASTSCSTASCAALRGAGTSAGSPLKTPAIPPSTSLPAL